MGEEIMLQNELLEKYIINYTLMEVLMVIEELEKKENDCKKYETLKEKIKALAKK